MKQVHNKKTLLNNRRELRNKLTSAEALLWNALQKSKLKGRKFRRQHSIDRYILDFYCPQERLAIELDGAHHYTIPGAECDNERDEYLRNCYIKVLRFENKLVFENLQSVLNEIQQHFKSDSNTGIKP
jgi:very-short-patch-repair endonuclease